MGRNRTIEGFGGFLQGFAQALQQGLAMRQRREENELTRQEHRADRAERSQDREESRRLREDEGKETERHHRAMEGVYGERAAKAGAAGGSSDAAERKIKSILFSKWNKKHDASPEELWGELNKPGTHKVDDLPVGLRLTEFKDRKPDEMVEVTHANVERAITTLTEHPELIGKDSLDERSAQAAIKRLDAWDDTNVKTTAERLKIDQTMLEGNIDRYRKEWEDNVRGKTNPQPTPGPESQPTSRPTGQGAPVPGTAAEVLRAALNQGGVQTRDGLVIDDISAAYAMRVSRDPQTSMMGKQLLATRGYPDVPSPFDMMDANGNPSPGMMMAAQRDPEIMALVQAQQQTQQQMQPGAQTQTSGSRPAMGKTGPTGGMLNQNPQIKKGSPPGSRPASRPASQPRYQQGSGYGSGRGQ